MMLVKDVMSADPQYFNASDLVSKARSVMREEGYKSFPVLENKKIVGIITCGDIMKVTSNKTNLCVSGLMTRNVTTVSGDEDIFSCSRALIKSGVRQMPVVDSGELVGLITAVDLLGAFLDNGYNPVKKDISDIMTFDVVCCHPEDDLSAIWDKMQSSGFSGLPVTSGDAVIGLVSRLDLLREGAFRLSLESGKFRRVQVNKVMRTPALTLKKSDTVVYAAEKMVEKNLDRMPVASASKKILGIIDLEDVLRAYVG